MFVFARELAELADRIEQEFFRIEHEDTWAAGLINGVLAGAAVAIVAWLVTTFEEGTAGDLLLFACLGSSSAAVVFAPIAKTNSLRSIVLAYAASCAVCLAMFPAARLQWLPVELQCFIAVTLSIFLMRLLDALHPAAVGSAMAFIIYKRDAQSLVLLMFAIVGLLVVIKILAYIYREELTFREFHREFRKAYYGKEVTVAVAEEQPEPSSDSDRDDSPGEETPQGVG